MKKLVLLSVLFAAATEGVFCQSTIGLPAIRNYNNTEYHAAIEMWDIAQDARGRLYFANNDGLLSYDGGYWQHYALPNKAAIKSLAIDAGGRIFVGGDDEIGFFSPGESGILRYHSLKEKLPAEAQQFADIWNIVIYRGAVFFRTNEAIIRWKDDSMQTYDAPHNWQLMALADTTLFAADKDKGLFVYRDGRWMEAAYPKEPLHFTGIAPYKKDTFLVATLKNGLYLLSGKTLVHKATPADGLLVNDLINNIRVINKDQYALGTATGGVLILDGEGRLVQRFSSGEGMQNNNVLRTLTDRDQHLWMGLENGVSFVHYNTPVQLIRPMQDNQLVSNAVRIFDGKLYIGTSNGLYFIPLDPAIRDLSTMKGVFTEVGNTKGQVWGLEAIGGQLLVGHQDGASVVQGGVAAPFMSRQGVWVFREVDLVEAGKTGDRAKQVAAAAWGGDRAIVAGTYTGLVQINDREGQLVEGDKLNRLYEALPVIAYDGEHTIWASHPYRGVFRNPLPNGRKPTYSHYGVKEGLPSNLNNYVVMVNGKVTVGTEKGVYEYDAVTDRFVRSAFFGSVFGDTSVEYLNPDKDGNIWFVSSQRVGVVDLHKPDGQAAYSVVYFPELKGQTVKGAITIYPYNKENIFIGSNSGVYHLNYSRYLESTGKVTVLLGSVKAIAAKDSLIFGGYPVTGGAAVRLPNHWNSLNFEYASPLYTATRPVEFSYRLEGFDREWSDWTERSEKDYTNLPSGEYTFSVRARDDLGNISAPAAFTFIVNPAWYEAGWAYLLYGLMAAGLILLVRRRQRQRLELHRKQYEEEQERQNYLHSLELDRKEKGLIALQNAKLEGELQFKNKELATVTMHLVERGGILHSIKDELVAVIKRLGVPNLTYEFRSVFRMINDTEKSDDDWNRFALYFDEVHNDFLAALKAKFPQLSPTDLKLCAYLRLNLSSKEIAQLLNISLKGVEVSRYRLRKKLNLATETNLHDFLIEVA